MPYSSPDVIDAAICAAVALIRSPKSDEGERLRADAEGLELQLQRLSNAIAEGGEITALIPAIRAREAARTRPLHAFGLSNRRHEALHAPTPNWSRRPGAS